MSIKVYTAEEALAAVQANPNKVLTAEKKKDDKPCKGGSRFLNAYWTVGADVKKDGWFSIENIPLSDGIADPSNKNDKRNDFDGTRLQLQTSVSRAGAFGQFLNLLNPGWRTYVDSLIKDGVINANGKKVHDLLQLTLSDNNEKTPGAKIEDPIIRFKIDFGTFPQLYKHKFLVGQPKTQIFDFRTEYTDDKGNKQYKPAMVKDPATGADVPVNEKNIHLFVTKGSVLRKGRIMITSLAISQSWISLPIYINRAVIEPGAEEGFSDDTPSATVNNAVRDAVNPQPTNPQPTNPQPTNPQPTNPQPTNPQPAADVTVDDISAVLAEM